LAVRILPADVILASQTIQGGARSRRISSALREIDRLLVVAPAASPPPEIMIDDYAPLSFR